MNRREFIVSSAFAAAAVAGLATFKATPATAASISYKRVSLKECQALTPQEMVENSEMIKNGVDFLKGAVSRIKNADLRTIGERYLNNPAPTIMERYAQASDRENVRKQLVSAGYLSNDITVAQLFPKTESQKTPQPIYSAPGSGYSSHHCYPGGLITHLAANVSIAEAIVPTYKEVYGYDVNNDTVILAQLLHDFHKPWIFQWMPSGECLPEITLVDQGAHHVTSLAQAVYNGFSPELIVAMACAHTPALSPNDKEQIASWLKAACILAGKEPVKYGLLAANGAFPLSDRQEGFITHLGDHDFVLSLPAARDMILALGRIAVKDYRMKESDLKTASFNSFRNYLASQASMMRMHNIWANGGDDALRTFVKGIITL